MGHMRLEFAFFIPAQQLGIRVTQELRPARLVGPPVKADDINIFYQQDIGWRLRDASGSEADNNDTAAPCNRAQAGVKRIAAHWVIDHIRTAVSGDGPYPFANVLSRIINQMVCAMLSRDLQLFRTVGAGN